MKAVQYTEIGAEPVVVEIPKPSPGGPGGEILLKVTAAGLCHSDIFVMDLPADGYGYGLPLTLGHEGVGTVAELGAGVGGFAVATRSPCTGRGGAAATVMPAPGGAARTTAFAPPTSGSPPRRASVPPPDPWPNT